MVKVVNRVVETTQTTGTGTLDLGGAQTGYHAFADELLSGDQVYYAIEDDPSSPSAFEYGVGVWTAGSPNTLSRDTVLGSSNGGNRISLLGGTTYTVTGTIVRQTLQELEQAIAAIAEQAASVVPVGSCIPYSGVALPPRFLWPLGQDVSRATYSALFAATTIQQTGSRTSGSAVINGIADTSQMLAGMAVCGTGIQTSTVIASVNSATQITLSKTVLSAGSDTVIVAPNGVGDGTSTFGVIDLRGVVAAGRDDMGGTAAGRLTGLSGGVDGRRLGAIGGMQTHTLSVAQMPAHTHLLTGTSGTDWNPGAGTTIRGSSEGATQRQTGSAGSSQAHNNVQPTAVVNYILHAGA